MFQKTSLLLLILLAACAADRAKEPKLNTPKERYIKCFDSAAEQAAPFADNIEEYKKFFYFFLEECADREDAMHDFFCPDFFSGCPKFKI